VPGQFIPGVEKGVRESLRRGFLSGNPMVYVKVALVDGKYHPVDSSAQAFEVAASLGMHRRAEQDRARRGGFADLSARRAQRKAQCAQFGLGLALARTGDPRGAAEHLALAAAMRPDLRHYTDALRQVRATLRARGEVRPDEQ